MPNQLLLDEKSRCRDAAVAIKMKLAFSSSQYTLKPQNGRLNRTADEKDF